MDLIRTIQKRVEPYPLIYRVLLAVYGLFGEVRFLLHAVLSGKLKAKIASSAWSSILSRQSIPYRRITAGLKSPDEFKQWLSGQGIRFLEGGWTIYIPPQERMESCFGFLRNEYPPDAGLKVLKNFQGPETAIYTKHGQHPAPGVAIMRSLTPSPVALIRIANYLYRKGLGIRIYDIIGLTCSDTALTCYVVEHVGGSVTQETDYRVFMDRMRAVLKEGDLTTAHARVDIIEDLMPPDCNANLRLRPDDGRPLYVDFQGFLFRNEDRMIERVFLNAGPHVLFDMEELGKGGDRVWETYRRMLDEAGCGVEGRLVMEIGCNPSFVAYEALSAGAAWVVGWYPPAVRRHMERILLTLGATRFDTFDKEPQTGDAELIQDIPRRYRKIEKGLIFLSDREQGEEDFHNTAKRYGELPWEYAVCGAGWELPGVELLSESHWVDSDGKKRLARLFRRTGKGRDHVVE